MDRIFMSRYRNKKMKAKWKGNNNEREKSQEIDKNFGYTLEHYEVDANGGKVSQNEHYINPQQGYNYGSQLMSNLHINSVWSNLQEEDQNLILHNLWAKQRAKIVFTKKI